MSKRKKLSLEVIERWLKDPDWRVRQAAMNACNGKDVPLEVIERGLKDPDCDVRQAAMNACKLRGIPVPVIRTFEPPSRVFKKCVADVIVVAEIPADAQVRGGVGRKCRTNKATIVEVIGTFARESVGVSLWDKTTTYFVGDEVEIPDFDMSDEECSTGYHFFCTREEAERYGL